MNQNQIETDVIKLVTGICIIFNRDVTSAKPIVDEAYSRVKNGEEAENVIREVIEGLSKTVDPKFVPSLIAKIESTANRLEVQIKY